MGSLCVSVFGNAFQDSRKTGDWLFARINLDSKIQIKYIDRHEKTTCWNPKGIFTRDEWNHMLSSFNISHFSFTVYSETMAKRLQQDSGEERVTVKSRPMMSLIARVPMNVSSSTSVSPGQRVAEKGKDRGDPISAATERPHSTTITTSNWWKVFFFFFFSTPLKAWRRPCLVFTCGKRKQKCERLGDPM